MKDGWTEVFDHPSLRCDYCGEGVWGSDAPSLDAAKEAHRENCPGNKLPANSGRFASEGLATPGTKG